MRFSERSRNGFPESIQEAGPLKNLFQSVPHFLRPDPDDFPSWNDNHCTWPDSSFQKPERFPDQASRTVALHCTPVESPAADDAESRLRSLSFLSFIVLRKLLRGDQNNEIRAKVFLPVGLDKIEFRFQFQAVPLFQCLFHRQSLSRNPCPVLPRLERKGKNANSSGGLIGQSLASLRPARGKDLTASPGGHSCSESAFAGSFDS